MSNLKTSEASILDTYRIALENAGSQPDIASELYELGYDAVKIYEGKKKLAFAITVYNSNKQETVETTEASAQFKKAQQTLVRTYMVHRKKGKIIFRDQPETLKRLQLTGTFPIAYIRWFEAVKTFYSTLSSEPDLLLQMQGLKVDAALVAEAQTQIKLVEDKRAIYLREKGESEDATQKKDKAFAEIDRWMSDFYAVARIALEDRPQLLEALGKVVK
jgi:hypothetical protein